jgi:hypothetical protein
MVTHAAAAVAAVAADVLKLMERRDIVRNAVNACMMCCSLSLALFPVTVASYTLMCCYIADPAAAAAGLLTLLTAPLLSGCWSC